MVPRRTVSKIRHLTGSLYRGEARADLPRAVVAHAIRRSRKLGRLKRRGGLDAVRMTIPASSIPTHPAYVPGWPVDEANLYGPR